MMAELQTIYDDVEALTERVVALENTMATVLSQLSTIGVVALTEGQNILDLPIGEYFIPNAEVCATFLNKPTSSNATGRVSVVSTGDSGRKSIYYVPCSKTITRYFVISYYDGSWGNWNEIVLTDTDWTTLPLTSGISAYSESQTPKYRKIGNVVYLKGAVKNITGNCTIGILPEGFRPHTASHSYVQNTSYSNGAQITRMCIETDGKIEIEGISNGGSYGADKWFPIHTEFTID